MQRLEQYDVFPIPVGRIYYDTSFNCRGEFTLQSVQELSENISQLGRLLAPVWVQPAADVPGLEGFDFRLIAGHRRFKAITTYLGWTEIPGIIFAGLSDRQARVLNFTENLERADLNPLEEALAIKALYPMGVTAKVAAQEFKKSENWVLKRLRILQVPEQVQQLVAARRVTLLDLQIVCKRQGEEAQIKAAEALAASKRGRGRNAVFVGEKLTRTFKRRKNKSEINAAVAMILNLGLNEAEPLLARGLVWAAGGISDEVFYAELFEKYKNRSNSTAC